MDGCQGAHNPKVVGSNPTPATIAPVQRPRFGGASLVLGALPVRYRDLRALLRIDEVSEKLGRVALHPGQHVLVDGHRERRRRVPEPLADHRQQRGDPADPARAVVLLLDELARGLGRRR